MPGCQRFQCGYESNFNVAKALKALALCGSGFIVPERNLCELIEMDLTMQEFRYFVAAPDGVTHYALSRMEAASIRIKSALDILDSFRSRFSPARVTWNGELKALPLFPHINSETSEGVSLKAFDSEKLIQIFQKSAAELSKLEEPCFALPTIYMGDQAVLKVDPSDLGLKVKPAIRNIFVNLEILDLNPNIAIKIYEFAQEQHKPSFQDPNKAVLTVNGASFYPEARNVSSVWFMKLPQYVSHYGNDYVPPDCKEISSQTLAELVAPATFIDFPAVDRGVRERLTKMETFEICQPET